VLINLSSGGKRLGKRNKKGEKIVGTENVNVVRDLPGWCGGYDTEIYEKNVCFFVRSEGKVGSEKNHTQTLREIQRKKMLMLIARC
jgi:hypothetical protein